MLEVLPNIICVGFILVFLVFPAWIRMQIVDWRGRSLRKEAEASGRHEPATIQPLVDLSVCMGSGTCVSACPEDVLRVVDGQAVVVDGAACVGHGACAAACPVDAIRLVFGSARRGVDIPEVGPDFQTNVPGLFVAGELGGMGLIANAVEQGVQAVTHAAKGLRPLPGVNDIIVVGAGPAGLAAGAEAAQQGLKHVVLEQDAFGGAIRHYPRQKLVFSRPMRFPGAGRISASTMRKEQLVEALKKVVVRTGMTLRTGVTVEKVQRMPDGTFEVRTQQSVERAQRVILAIGRRGTPRRLEVPGEDQEKVAYWLVDAELYRNQHILVVGGGDSAVEAAVSLSQQPGNRVWLSYRRDKITRPKKANLDALRDAVRNGGVQLVLNSTVTRIGVDRVVLDQDGEQIVLPNDFVFVFAGGVLPTGFLEAAGVRIETHYGDRIETRGWDEAAPVKATPAPQARRSEPPARGLPKEMLPVGVFNDPTLVLPDGNALSAAFDPEATAVLPSSDPLDAEVTAVLPSPDPLDAEATAILPSSDRLDAEETLVRAPPFGDETTLIRSPAGSPLSGPGSREPQPTLDPETTQIRPPRVEDPEATQIRPPRVEDPEATLIRLPEGAGAPPLDEATVIRPASFEPDPSSGSLLGLLGSDALVAFGQATALRPREDLARYLAAVEDELTTELPPQEATEYGAVGAVEGTEWVRPVDAQALLEAVPAKPSGLLEIAHRRRSAGQLQQALDGYLDAAEQYARHGAVRQLDIALEQANSVLAELPNAPSAARVRLLLLQGEAHLAAERWDAALVDLQEAVMVGTSAGDPDWMARALGALARAWSQVGRQDLADAVADEVWARPTSALAARGAAHRALAALELGRTRLDRAHELLGEAWDLALAGDNPDEEARACRGMADLRALQGRLVEAAELLERAASRQTGQDLRLQAGILARSLEVRAALGRYGAALRDGEGLLELARSQRLASWMPEACARLGNGLLAVGIDDLASDAAELALQVLSASAPWRARVETARLLLDLGRDPTAYNVLDDLEAPESPVDDPPSQVAALRARSLARREPAAARDLAGATLARPVAHPVRGARIRQDAAVALLAAGETALARKACKRGLELLANTDAIGARLELLVTMYRARPEPRVLEAIGRAARRVLVDLPPEHADAFRGRPVIADALG